jgi:hypothetical protein
LRGERAVSLVLRRQLDRTMRLAYNFAVPPPLASRYHANIHRD